MNDFVCAVTGGRGDCARLARKAPLYVLRKRAMGCGQLLEAIAMARDEEIEKICWKHQLTTAELYDTGDMASLTETPMLDEPYRMVTEKKCPFFMHELFHRDYEKVLLRTLGHQGQVFYAWLKETSGWDENLLWNYLLPNYHMEDLFWNLHLTYVLPTKGADQEGILAYLNEHRLALVMHLYYTDKLQESCSFAARFPRQTAVFITTNSTEKQQIILQAFKKMSFARLEVRVIANRGRDVSSLLVGARDVYDEYEYVCFFHDKKTLQTKPGSIGVGFAYKLAENMFASGDYVLNVIQTFRDNARLGLLTPPPPHHADYFFTLGTNWGPNYQLTYDLYRQLGFTAPIAENKMPVTPLGTCFWFRSAALMPLLKKEWTYEDFPPEPNNADGTVLHAIERIYHFSCVEAGMYPAYVLSDRYAGVEYTSMRHYVRGFNTVCFKHGIMGYQRNMRYELIARLNR
ncbi:MAG: rhamnan synthesis F family protein [Aristaeellaceae bacterium]